MASNDLNNILISNDLDIYFPSLGSFSSSFGDMIYIYIMYVYAATTVMSSSLPPGKCSLPTGLQ